MKSTASMTAQETETYFNYLEFQRAIRVIKGLLNTTELNMDDMEHDTKMMIFAANDFLGAHE